MTDPFERSLLTLAAAVPDAVEVAPDAVWRRVARRRRARRTASAAGACALFAAVVMTGVGLPPMGGPTTVSAEVTGPAPTTPGTAPDEPGDVPVQADVPGRTVDATASGVDAVPASELYAAPLPGSLLAARTAGLVRLSDSAPQWCADPSAQGTFTEHLLVGSIARRVVATLDMPDATVVAVTACFDPLVLVVRVTDALPRGVESLVADAARLGVTILWVAGPEADDAATGASR